LKDGVLKTGSAKSTAKTAVKKAVKKTAAKSSAAKSSAAKSSAAKSSDGKSSAAKPRATKASIEKAATKFAAPKTTKAKTTKAKVGVVAKAAKAAKPEIAKPKTAVSRTRKATAPVLVEQASAGSATLDLILAKIDDMKAEQTVTIDLRGKSAFSDFMVVTSGRSNRHVGAVAETISKGLKEKGIKGLHVEGLTNCAWVLIDTGEVIVHIFRPEVREFYNLERLWTQTPDALAKPA
jgi:ribosome-associated protein